MKIYYASHSIRLSGKAWEIKQKIKEWANQHTTVYDLLKEKGH